MSKKTILKLDNKSEHFYEYMGKFFGSRLVQNKIHDRIYDDPEKIWYILLENQKAVGFVALIENCIKSIYAPTEEEVEYLLLHIEKEINIKESVVPKLYIDVYNKIGLKTYDDNKYKNFVIIASKKDDVQ